LGDSWRPSLEFVGRGLGCVRTTRTPVVHGREL